MSAISNVYVLIRTNRQYKFTLGTNIFCCIICATCASIFEAPARYMWFGFGFCLFTGPYGAFTALAPSEANAFPLAAATWLFVIGLVRRRLDQFTPLRAEVGELSKSTKGLLKAALGLYFCVWCGYPTLWVLLEAGVIDPVTSHCIHVFLDIFAKSGPKLTPDTQHMRVCTTLTSPPAAYGFALLKFQLSSEKRDYMLTPLRDVPVGATAPVVKDLEGECYGFESSQMPSFSRRLDRSPPPAPQRTEPDTADRATMDEVRMLRSQLLDFVANGSISAAASPRLYQSATVGRSDMVSPRLRGMTAARYDAELAPRDANS